MLSSSIIAIIIVEMIFICSFLVECLLCNHTFPTNPNKYNTNFFFETYISLVLIYQSLYILHFQFILLGCVRGYNWLEPLLRTLQLSAHLLRSLCVLRNALDAVPKRQWYPSCQRVYARLTYEIKRLGK